MTCLIISIISHDLKKVKPAERYKESLGAMEEDEMNEENCATYHLVLQL